MSLELVFDNSDSVDLVQAWQRVPEIVGRELSAATQENLLLLEREIKELTPTGVGGGGGLRGSIAAQQPKVSADEVFGVVASSSPHAMAVELGTKPHFPPIAPLKDWVKAKLGITGEKEITSTAWAVAKAISIRGTVGVGMFHRSFAAQEENMMARYELAVARIVQAMQP